MMNLEIADPSAETRNLIARWRDIVKPGTYRQPGGRWKKYQEPRLLRNERRIIEEQLQQALQILECKENSQIERFQPQTRRHEQ